MSSIQPISIENATAGDNRHYVFGWQQLQEVEKDFIEAGITYIRSAHSLYVPATRHKWLNVDGCFWWKDVNGELLRMTPGEIARTELYKAFGKPKIWVKKEDEYLLKMPPPNFYDGNVYQGDIFYLDLSGAYHQIYTWLDIDCVWPRGHGVLPLASVATRLAEIKLARNSVVGISRSVNALLSHKDKETWIHIHNPYYNPALWRTIQSIMHELAETAVMLGAVYVATDGYLFVDKGQFKAFQDTMDSLQLNYKTKTGEGYIQGWAQYKVGDKQTKVTGRKPLPLDNIILGERSLTWWLRTREERQKPSIIGVPLIPTTGKC